MFDLWGESCERLKGRRIRLYTICTDIYTKFREGLHIWWIKRYRWKELSVTNIDTYNIHRVHTYRPKNNNNNERWYRQIDYPDYRISIRWSKTPLRYTFTFSYSLARVVCPSDTLSKVRTTCPNFGHLPVRT